jgi:CRP-like cAMP-binding protein
MLQRADEPALFNHLVEFAGTRHTVLQRAGEPTGHVYFPISGMISFLTVMRNGEAVETAAVGYDNAAGYNTALSGRNSNCQLVVQIAGRSLRIEKEAFRRSYNGSGAVRHMIHVGNELLIEQVQQTAACHALHGAEQRLARWLLQSHDYAGGDTLDLTQDFVAEMIGVRRTTVSLMANTLQQEGLISYRRGHVTILDRNGLEQRCCECYTIVSQHRNAHPQLRPLAGPPGRATLPDVSTS